MRPQVTALFWDIGGVLLTNGWDRHSRQEAVERFGLEREEFDQRHAAVAADFEAGRLSLDGYLERTVFCRSRSFSRQEFKEFMLAQSRPHADVLDLAARLARSRRWLMAAINNESLELNLHRIRKFGLRERFSAFFSSCFLGLRKPDPRIFRTALQVTQREPGECLFLDDRQHNVEAAREVGFHGIHFSGADRLVGTLASFGIEI